MSEQIININEPVVECCGLRFRLPETYGLNDGTIVSQFAGLCPKCEAYHTATIYGLDGEELQDVRDSIPPVEVLK